MLTGAAILLTSLCACSGPAKEDVRRFNTIADNTETLLSNNSDSVPAAQAVLDGTDPNDLANPKVLEDLRKEIEASTGLEASIPEMAADADEVARQIDDLRKQYYRLKGQYDDLQAAIDAIEASRQRVAEANKNYSYTAVDGNGNTQKVTINIGVWIKGSEQDRLQTAWESFKGTDQIPLSGDTGFTPNDAAYVVGSVTIENLTPDFDASNFGGGNSSVYLSLYKQGSRSLDSDLGRVVAVVQYGNEQQACDVNGGGPLIRADMQSNKWGPVPFVIGVDTVFSPKYPDGNPALASALFVSSRGVGAKESGTTEFQADRTW